MKKYFLMLAVVLFASQPAYAQLNGRQDPFDSFFDTMMFQPQKLMARQFVREPKMDVVDLKDKIEVKIELAGMSEKDFNLTCEDGVLTINGERKQEVEEQDKNYYLKEISSGAFSRSIQLPKNIDESKIEAVFKNGVLTVVIPKTEVKENQLKKIPIKTEE